jgi:hypothetical protein
VSELAEVEVEAVVRRPGHPDRTVAATIECDLPGRVAEVLALNLTRALYSISTGRFEIRVDGEILRHGHGILPGTPPPVG